MAQPDRELGEFLRRSMRATAEFVAVGEDGLDKIWTRLAASPFHAADALVAVAPARQEA
jgi:hypothetical protein